MDGKKKSFMGQSMAQTQGLARNASQVFFRQETTEIPVTRRKIFFVSTLVFLGYFGGALAIVILFFQQPSLPAGVASSYSTVTAPPVNWGEVNGVPCPFGGCTPAPVPITLAPVTPAPSTPAPSQAPTV